MERQIGSSSIAAQHLHSHSQSHLHLLYSNVCSHLYWCVIVTKPIEIDITQTKLSESERMKHSMRKVNIHRKQLWVRKYDMWCIYVGLGIEWKVEKESITSRTTSHFVLCIDSNTQKWVFGIVCVVIDDDAEDCCCLLYICGWCCCCYSRCIQNKNRDFSRSGSSFMETASSILLAQKSAEKVSSTWKEKYPHTKAQSSFKPNKHRKRNYGKKYLNNVNREEKSASFCIIVLWTYLYTIHACVFV